MRLLTAVSVLLIHGEYACAHRKRMPGDEVPRRVLLLLLDQLRSCDLPTLEAAGAWTILCDIVFFRPALAPVALELDFFGVAVAWLETIGSGGGWAVSSALAIASPVWLVLNSLAVLVEFLECRRMGSATCDKSQCMHEYIQGAGRPVAPCGSRVRSGVLWLVRRMRVMCRVVRSWWCGEDT